jgi:hypothetical protein
MTLNLSFGAGTQLRPPLLQRLLRAGQLRR